jgi:hypothetical protein
MSFYKQINLLSINKNKIHKRNRDDVIGVVNHLKLRFKRFRKFYFDFSAILNLKNYEKHSIISKISIQFQFIPFSGLHYQFYYVSCVQMKTWAEWALKK